MNMYNASLAAISGGSEVITITNSEVDLDFSGSITVSELIGAKYFMIIGNGLTSQQSASLSYVNDTEIIHTLIYIDGEVFLYYPSLSTGNKTVDFNCAINVSDSFSFDENTGTIVTSDCDAYFNRLSVDDTEGDVVYTVYRLG